MLFLKADTISTVQFGPFLDKTDGVSLEVGLATAMDNATTGIRVSKNGAVFADRNSATAPAYDAMGFYRVALSATDTDTEGRLQLVFEEAATCLPVWAEFMVVSANVYDSLFAASGTDMLQVDLQEVVGATTNVSALATNVDAILADTGTDGVVIAAGQTVATATAVTTVNGLAAGVITAASIATDAVDANALAADALAEIKTQADTALTDIHMDHLMAAAAADVVVDGSVIAHMVSATEDWSTFVPSTDSLEAVRARGDAAWTTGAGGSDRLLMVDTTIATLATQVSFTLTAGSTDDGAYEGCTIVIEDVSTSTQKAIGIVDVYTGATKTVTLLEDPGVFTMAATDKVYILAEKGLKPTTSADYHVDVSSGGAVGIDWANVESPTTAVDLSATDIQLVDTVTTYTGNTLQTADVADAITDLDDIKGTSFVKDTHSLIDIKTETAAIVTDTGTDIPALLPAALVGGRIDANVGAISGDANAADMLEASMETLAVGTATGGSTSTVIATGFTDTSRNDTYIGRVLLFRSGTMDKESGVITDYDTATKTWTFAASTFTTAATTETFVIV